MSKTHRVHELLSRIPKDGFLRVGSDLRMDLPQEKRVALVRKGNELFNRGEFELAEKIFLATGYADGLIRLGDHYYEQKQVLDALRMYWLAPDRKKVDSLIERAVRVLEKWLRDEDD